MNIDQGPAAVPRVHGCIGLNEGLQAGAPAQNIDIAGFGRYNPGGDGGIQVEGIPDGQNPLADLQCIAVSGFDIGQLGGLYFDQGQVRTGVLSNDLAVEAPLVVEDDFDFIGVFDDMVVGDDVPIGRHDYPGARTHGGPSGHHIRAIKEVAEHVHTWWQRALHRAFLTAFGFDMHNTGGHNGGRCNKIGVFNNVFRKMG